MNNDVHFSSKKQDWLTPKYLFDYFNETFKFTLDPCASADNALCKKFYTEHDDGLSKSWENEHVFLNPPYGRDIGKWIEKAYKESADNNALVVCLLPARTDTHWFWDYCKHGFIMFLQGRVKFSGHKNSAPFPSMIVVFSPFPARKHTQEEIGLFSLNHKEIKSISKIAT